MSDFQGKTALIIEDDMLGIRVLEELLDQNQIASIAISDSANIEQHLSEIEIIPDVIFLDLEMPRNNGYSVLEMIQGDADFSDVPVIAYTTHISHLNDVKNAGFTGFLGKPIDGDMFPENLARIFAGEQVWEVPA